MRRFGGGYTVVEVMIFLAISAVIFLAAVLVFDGQRGKTQFEQGMHDLASQLQQYVDQTSTSIFPNSTSYICSTSSGRAELSYGAGGGVGTNQSCLFLGRAVQIIDGQSQIFVYTILGSAINNGQPVTSFEDADPEPAISPINLTDEYDTPWGTVKSGSPQATPLGGGSAFSSDLVGFYNSLQDGYNNSGSQGGQSIIAKGYHFTSAASPDAHLSGIQACIEEQGNCVSPPQISAWSICFASTGSNQTALLNVSSTPAGVNITTDFTSC